MRRLCSRWLAFGLAAAVLGLPAAAQAGGPKKPKCPHSTGSYKCPACQLADAERAAGGAPIIVNGPTPPGVAAPGCAACAASAGGAVVMMDGGEAPGVAHLGGAHPGGMMMPGGGVRISGEPTPIGVVRASYDQDARRAPAAPGMMGFDPTHGAPKPNGPVMMGSPGMGMSMGMPPGYVPPAPTPMGTGHRRTSVLGHVLGLDGFGRFGEARAARKAAEHAAIPMGAPAAYGRPTEVPASMVYGR
jgi:hypothetical protein